MPLVSFIRLDLKEYDFVLRLSTFDAPSNQVCVRVIDDSDFNISDPHWRFPFYRWR